MVTRKAILIGINGGYRGLSILKGVKIDLKNYRAFLRSKLGGQWMDSEIEILEDPDSKSLTEIISNLQSDYTFIVFIGHGSIKSYTSTDKVCLKDNDVEIGKLVSPSKKQTIIIDASFRTVELKSERISEHFSFESIDENYYKDTREDFDNAIVDLPNGVLLVFSTLPDVERGDDISKGSCFSYSLLKAGENWQCEGNGILTIDNAVAVAEKIMKKTFQTNQRPEMAGQTRRLTFPPFAISKQLR